MRRTAYPTLISLLLVAALIVPAAAPAYAAHAAAGAAKVVVIVGPTQSATADYIEDATSAAAAARTWTSNVVELYSPDADWASVSSALQGASIVVYMGHGNGFPNPRAKQFDGATMDGMGLDPAPGNAKSGGTKYYGEDVIAQRIRLAPNAVVILGHLCYAGGSSEPGDEDPTADVARERADNFAAGWLKAGAGAVIADAWYGSAATVINGLFSSASTLEQVWRTLPSANGAESVAPSTRTPGATLTLDPNGTTYYRAITAMPGLTAADVVGGRTSDTATVPSALKVPGAAEVGAAGAALYPSVASAADAAPTSLAPGTRVRVVRSVAAPDSGPLAGIASVQVRTLDGGVEGIVAADALLPRDSAPPIAYLLDGAASGISPNGDGIGDVLAVSGKLSEPAQWKASIADADGRTIWHTGALGDIFSVTWDGSVNGVPVADGRYTVRVDAADDWGNAAVPVTLSVTVDRTVPKLAATLPAAPATISPDGDGVADTLRTAYSASEAGTLTVSVRTATGAVVDTSQVPNPAGASAVIWDGRGAGGTPLPDGEYVYEIVPRDAAGNAGPALVRRVIVSTTIGFVRSSASVVDPVTPSATVRSAELTFTLARPASVTWSMADAKGRSIRFFAKDRAMTAGPQRVTWDGRDDAGASVAPGTYTMVVRADDGVTRSVGRVTVGVGPFRVVAVPAAPVRGKLTTFTVTTALTLTKAPKATLELPSGASIDLVLAAVEPGAWRAKVRIPKSAGAGGATLVVAATDASGAELSSTIRFAVK